MEHPLIDKKRRFSFILITSLFALWGFANDITNPMVAAFQTLLELSAAKASLIQFAFYGGYATMAIPAALFIRKYSYKRGIQLGLLLYACGAFLFIPAAAYQEFSFFCLSLYILTFGLAFLETTANPFILSLGSKATSTRRLNLAQAFNPIGSLCGMAIASLIVLPQLISDQRDEAGAILYPTLSATEKAAIRLHDIAIIRDPYVALGLVVVAILVVVTVVKMPDVAEQKTKLDVKATLRRLWKNRLYRQGVVTQVFYVAAQIMVWTFIIQYADHLGIEKATAQMYNIVAMSLSLTGRFVGTWLMKYVSSRKLLTLFAIGASICTLGTILLVNIAGLLSGGHLGIYVHHVPIHLRHCLGRRGGARHHSRRSLSGGGHCRWQHSPTSARMDHRPRSRVRSPCRQLLLRSPTLLLHPHLLLRTACHAQPM